MVWAGPRRPSWWWPASSVGAGARVAASAARWPCPALVDLACVLTAPVERRLAGALRRRGRRPARPGGARPWWPSPARTARRAPRATSPIWCAGTRSVVASPASFNNRAGLARAVNEHLADGTEVFVAEMGTYGPGEIAELCSWCPPDIAVITAIGPVHLERFGSEDAHRRGQGRDPRAARGARCSWSTTRAWRRWPTGAERRRGRGCGACSATDTRRRRVRGARATALAVLVRRRSSWRAGTSPCDRRPARQRRLRRGRGRWSSASPADDVGRPAGHAAGGRRTGSSRPGRPGRCRRARRHLQRQPGRAPGAALRALGRRPGRRRRPPGGGHPGDGRARRPPGRGERALRARPSPRVATDLVVVGRTNRRALLAGAGTRRRHGAVGRGRRPPDAGGGLGARAPRARATSCCTRTTCRTTTLERRRTAARDRSRAQPARTRSRASRSEEPPTVSEVAVVFGGPSPEHDVSILTGLQAARELAGAGRGRRPGLYWSKTGEWYEVDPALEAAAFVDGVPRGAAAAAARRRRRTAGSPSRAAGWAGPGPCASTSSWSAATAGPGEDGTLQAALDLAGIAYTGPERGRGRAGHGQARLRRRGRRRPACPCCPGALLTARGRALRLRRAPTSSSPASAARRSASRWWRTSPPPWPGSAANPHLRAGAVVEPYRADLFDLQRGRADLAGRSQLSAVERPLRSTGTRRRSSATATSTSAARGWPAPPASCRPDPGAALDDGAAATRAADGGRLADVRGVARIDFLSDGDAVRVNEVNTIPGSLARYLWVDPPVPFADLLDDLLDEARQRPTHAYTRRRGRRDRPADGRLDRRQAGLRRLAVRRLQLLPGEQVLVDIRPHWSFLSGPLAVALVVIGAGVALDVGIPHTSVTLHWVEGLWSRGPAASGWRSGWCAGDQSGLVLTSIRMVERRACVARRAVEIRVGRSTISVLAASPCSRRHGSAPASWRS